MHLKLLLCVVNSSLITFSEYFCSFQLLNNFFSPREILFKCLFEVYFYIFEAPLIRVKF